MEQIVWKTEIQPNGDILLYFVNENSNHETTELARLENIQQGEIQELDENNFELTNVDGSETEDYASLQNVHTTNEINEEWKDEDVEKLLVFYIDNKESFQNNDGMKKHLWAVACKTMLFDKNATLCELEFNNLKKQYVEVRTKYQNGTIVEWPYYDLCNQAFHDDYDVKVLMNEIKREEEVVNKSYTYKPNEDGILVTKKDKNVRTSSDEKVELMLNLFLKYKESYRKYNSFRGIWDTIALEVGEEDADYWHKRFLNFKQHYIRMVYKRYESGPDKINWPYMKLFDKIFEGDEEFQRKYSKRPEFNVNSGVPQDDDSFNETERTVLVKYYFDCFHEFQDQTIPNNFLWHEIGRLLDKKPEYCKQKYREMKSEHFETLMEGGYDLGNRIPVAIILDNIIARETEKEIAKTPKKGDQFETWSKDEVDELVQFFYENMEMFKDNVCYYVCWNIVSKKLKKNIHSCKMQWQELTALYKFILEEKKENPDMQINWKYIDIFDRIFDYGMDANLLEGYEKIKAKKKDLPEKVAIRKINIKEEVNETYSEDEESFDERGFMKRSKRRAGDSKAFKILDYYQKNKDKFACSLRKKLSLWEILAKQLGITAYQCAHRFRNLKQVYMGYVQREINKPDMPILWPYYALCKKVFGYRAIKSKLKNGKMDSDDAEDWVAREIKQLINYFANNYDVLHNSIEDLSKWSDLTHVIGKTERACSEKFLELRKSYRKLKTMKARNPEVKVSWKYFNMMDDIFNTRESEQANNFDENVEMGDISERIDVDGIKTEMPEDDDFQYIIVIPEDQELSENLDSQVMIQDNVGDEQVIEEVVQSKPQSSKWNKRTKKRLLAIYLKYLRSHKGKDIDSRDMWKEISSKLMKSPFSCRRVLIKLKNQHRISASNEEYKTTSPYYKLIKKILQLKPKFAKIGQGRNLQEKKSYKDVSMSDEKVEQALQYYYDNLEEFLSPKFEKKYVWMELANFINEPVSKVFNKINYLKKTYNTEASETPFTAMLQEIIAKEVLLRDIFITDVKPVVNEGSLEEFWTDDETEQLLSWYLTHLDKFKNPKYVRSYLWMEATEILKKSPLICSKKMSEVRTQYRNMVREAPEELTDWRFFSLCQKIYGTGKKPANVV
ncbi:uncharacterized protein [Battus philenor]|uniref:uncharacterized protein n=1 Tax=Battus philenor TaxID=42288 RepID=UPI0035D08ECE